MSQQIKLSLFSKYKSIGDFGKIYLVNNINTKDKYAINQKIEITIIRFQKKYIYILCYSKCEGIIY